jgi:hypothetical protein
MLTKPGSSRFACSECGLAVIVRPNEGAVVDDKPSTLIIRACPHNTSAIVANMIGKADGHGGIRERS